MSDARGFTLVELLVAGLLIVLAMLGIAGMSLTAYAHLDRSGEQTTAVALGQQRIEWLRNQAYDSVSLSAGTTLEVLSGTYAGYTRATRIEDNLPRAGLKQITATVATPSGLSFETVSLLADR